jgi:hypothetical protein
MFSVALMGRFDSACTKALSHPLHRRWGSHTGYSGKLPPDHLVWEIYANQWNLQVSLSKEHRLEAHIAPWWLAPTLGIGWRELWSLLAMPPLQADKESRGLEDLPALAEALRALLENDRLSAVLTEKACACADRFPQTQADLSKVRSLYIKDESVTFGAFKECHDQHIRPLLEEHGYVQGPAIIWANALWSIYYFSRKGFLKHSLDTSDHINEMVFSFRDFAKGELLFLNQIAKARGWPLYRKRFDPPRFQDDVATLGAYLREHSPSTKSSSPSTARRRSACRSWTTGSTRCS